MSTIKPVLACAAFALALVACSSGEAPQPAADAPAAPADQPEQAVPPQEAAAVTSDRLRAILAAESRPEAERARDRYRHPRETLGFFGVQPGQTLIEVTPGAGWYSAVLAPLQKDSGTYIAALAADSSSDYAARSNAAWRERAAASADSWGEIREIQFDPAAPEFGPQGSADVVLTFRNVHNWLGSGQAEAMFQAFFDVLKPGGTLGVVEHRAAAGATVEDTAGSGYVPVEEVERLATAAGFHLVAQSEVNANPADTRDHPKGVWTLPPSLSLGDEDREKYLAIGESDRMTLRFEKPRAAAGDRIFRQGADGQPQDDSPAPAGDGD